MDEDLWRARWAEGRIGFHEGTPNAFLRAHVRRLLEGTANGSRRLLAPLAGKSVDLAFLASEGFDVVGVELVQGAAAAFFRENGLEPRDEPWHGYASLTADRVRFAIGDFFALSLPEDERFDAAYDRAALIAVRPEERERYVSTLMAALAPGAPLLLVTLAILGADVGGPPYSVQDTDVKRLFAAHRVDLLDEHDITEREPRFRERGATRVLEQVWLVTRR